MSLEQMGMWLLAELEGGGPNDRCLRNLAFNLLAPLTPKPAYQMTVSSQKQILAQHSDLVERMSAAWQWLLRQGYIAPDPQQSGGDWVNVTHDGRGALADPRALERLRARELLGRDVDSRLGKARRLFDGGDYDTAVHVALKAVEVAVRDAAGAGNAAVGVDLVTQAYKPGGPLADGTALAAEQEGVMALFRGAIAAYRNPVSHRDIEFDEPGEAAEVILLANLLLRITDRAASRRAGP